MNSDHPPQGLAHLWLYSAGIDPNALDSHGDTLASSLGKLLAKQRHSGRREAAAAFLNSRPSGEYLRSPARDEDSTGRYDVGQLDELLAKTAGRAH